MQILTEAEAEAEEFWQKKMLKKRALFRLCSDIVISSDDES